jgi:hypothetical protein
VIIRKPFRRYFVLLLVFALAGLVLLTIDIIRRQRLASQSLPSEPMPKSSAPAMPLPANQWEASLYFLAKNPSQAGRGILVEERRMLTRSGSIAEQARRVLDELVAGSRDGHLAVLPLEAKPLQFFLLPDGTAVINYSHMLIDKNPRGIESELACIYAIVNTLTRNFGEIASVRILIEGAEKETLCGHIDLSSSLKQDLSYVAGFEHMVTPVRVEKLPP